MKQLEHMLNAIKRISPLNRVEHLTVYKNSQTIQIDDMKDPHENYVQSLSVAATLRQVWCFPATLEFSTPVVQ